MKTQLHLIAEMDVAVSCEADAKRKARKNLDAFREATLPGPEYGICLYEYSPVDPDPREALIDALATALSAMIEASREVDHTALAMRVDRARQMEADPALALAITHQSERSSQHGPEINP